MALGFGFNKAKVLASAEKYVQQGKLQNAIAEYEKIIEKDAKDLTVLNTIGDLYARLGQNEKAGDFFKRVGDTYAGEGFTVKAIALYKKLTKLNPGNIPVVQRLAELYTQQGLYNDARQQYLQLADASIKANDLHGAVKIFQKMLEIDPDNLSLQSKLADLYTKIGKKDEAGGIFLKAAQNLYERGSAEQAQQAVDRLLASDPGNVEALLMRGKIALDAGDGATAARNFEKVPDIDSRPDGLQSLLRAHTLANNLQAVESIARKMATVHNDLSGIRSYADMLLAAGNGEALLNFYDEWVEQLLVGDKGELVITLQGLTGQVKEDPIALERLRGVFQKAGATANIPEVNELLAHSYVQVGDLAKARDLYKELAELEPSNPQHMLNYRQVMTRMGEEPTARPLPPAEAAKALFVEEIDIIAPAIQQDYSAPLAEKISTVLTDAELFESYNKPQQALGPLEGILTKAPEDVRVNQRLMSVYVRLDRWEDAAFRCDTLSKVYRKAGMADDGRKFAEMAARFRDRAGVPQPPPEEEPVAEIATTANGETPTQILAQAVAAPLPPEVAPALPVELGEAHEIDLSSEWEEALSQTAEAPVAAPEASELDATGIHPSVVADLLEEIRFYLSQHMLDEARSAITRCEQAAPASVELAALKEQFMTVSSGAAVAGTDEGSKESEESEAELDEATVVEFDFASATAETLTGQESPATFEVAAPEPQPEATVEEIAFPVAAAEQHLDSVQQPQAVEMEVVAPAAEPGPLEGLPDWARAPEPSFVEEAPAAPAQEKKAVEPEPVLEEVVLEEIVEEPVAIAKPEHVKAPVAEPEPVLAEVARAHEEKDILADFVLDLEEALPVDFGTPPTLPIPAPVHVAAGVAAAAAPAIAPQRAPEIAAAVMSPAVVAAETATVSMEAIASADASSALSDLFEEFKEEVGEHEDAEDPETHYNLGVAFKEMGLLDEAIGELQKVCKSIDRGASFGQVMQAYTWLAGCFIEKGVPEAGIKWYAKALTVAGNEESRTALHYDIASAYEASGDRPQALKHFTEVYGTNIDYRDVAERIKALKA